MSAESNTRAPRGFKSETADSSPSRTDFAFVKLLRDLPIFAGLDVDELDLVAGLFRKHLFKPDEIIFERESVGSEAYVILRGSVRITLDSGKPIGNFTVGHVFGELAFLDGGPRGAKAVATSPTILLIVQRSEFETLADTRTNIGRMVYKNIARELTERLRRMNHALEVSQDTWETAMFRKFD
ncbi:MAG: cyclic nucleotide-binding domain-containing protein [Verrucomicrobiae bacterium]|jgi:CRP-like cAMP-binding protein|nr:cyclic nucleotide-binding domain-containing protein [Verrucomicrobiae bacterium]